MGTFRFQCDECGGYGFHEFQDDNGLVRYPCDRCSSLGYFEVNREEHEKDIAPDDDIFMESVLFPWLDDPSCDYEDQ